MSVQTFGMAAFRRAVSRAMELAARAEEQIQSRRILELLNPASLGVVCFRINPAETNPGEEALEEINRTVLARVFWEDRAFVSSTLLRGTFALTWDDVRETLEVIETFGRQTRRLRTTP